MEQIHNIGVSGMTDCLGKRCLIITILTFSTLDCFSDENDYLVVPSLQEESITISNLTGKTIKAIEDSNLFGDLLDIYYPCEIENFFSFIFRKGKTIYQIAANTEYRNEYKNYDTIDLEKYIAIGYYAIINSNGEYKKMLGQSSNTPFDFLNQINPKEYISVKEIENMGNIIFDKVEKGGFYVPFYGYYCEIGNMILYIFASPSNDKEKSFFMGGWSYFSKN
jgi:hypothetical protein